MQLNNDCHPNRSILKDFAVGQLDPSIRPKIESHIHDCDQCCQELESLDNDTLLNRLKDLDTRTDLTENAEDAPYDIPIELLDHSRYEIVERIGTGGMGDVFRARHRMMDRNVAIKVIKPGLLDNKVAISRFRNEIKAAAKLSHKNIVASHDAEQIGKTQLLVMEYIDGRKLSDYVTHRKPLSIRRACFFARQLALGLEYAHQQGMIHRDIKPQNVLVTHDGIVKFLDFGLAKFVREVTEEKQDAALTAEGECFGTPDYIAPEQIRSSKHSDIRADIYSLGCTLRFMLTGHPPFPTGTVSSKLAAHLERMPEPITEYRDDVPIELAALLDQLVAKSPDDRPQTPADVAKALKPFCVRNSPELTSGRWPSKAAAISAADSTALEDHPTNQESISGQFQSASETHAGSVSTQIEPNQLTANDHKNSIGQRARPEPSDSNRPSPGFFGRYTKTKITMLVLASGLWLMFASNQLLPPFPNTNQLEKTDYSALVTESAANLKVKRVLLVVPFRNAYYLEFEFVQQWFENQNEIELDIVSSQLGMVSFNGGRKGHSLEIVQTLSQVSAHDYGAVIFTGAWDGPDRKIMDLEFAFDTDQREIATRFIQDMDRYNRIIASVCAGTLVLERSGILDYAAASRCQFIDEFVVDSNAEWDDSEFKMHLNLWTARSHEELDQLCEAITHCLKIQEPPDYSNYQ